MACILDRELLWYLEKPKEFQKLFFELTVE